MNNIITASRLNSLLNCARSHFWSYEVGLTKDDSSPALRFGSAWHRAMEERWKGAAYEKALAIAIPEGIELDEYACAMLAALLAGYYDHYGKVEKVGKLNPEIEFENQIEGTDFIMRGKIDGLGSMKSGRSVLVEAKTTSSRIDSGSDYWLRLRFNLQVLHYVDNARRLGWDIADVFYDVVRKPKVKPCEIPDLDKQGRKIVVDKNGNRIFAKKKIKEKVGKGKKAKLVEREVDNLEKPRQSGSEENGWSIKTHTETPDEFCDRIWKDCMANPSNYFVRKEIPIIESEMEQFQRQRLAMVGMIEDFRKREQGFNGSDLLRDPEAWPRNVGTNTCQWCRYQSFCLSNITVDINHPPQGFAVKPFNPELEPAVETATEETAP